MLCSGGGRCPESAAIDSRGKSGFGERRCVSWPRDVKIFLLPKITTQSPRTARLSALPDDRRVAASRERDQRELKKPLQQRHFLHSSPTCGATLRGFLASPRKCFFGSSMIARRAPVA
jgi:hypothetical protein